MLLTTHEVADLLGTEPDRLLAFLRRKRIRPSPTKNSAGMFMWEQADIERARAVLAEVAELRRQGKAPGPKPRTGGICHADEQPGTDPHH